MPDTPEYIEARDRLRALWAARRGKVAGELEVNGVVIATASYTPSGFYIQLTNETRKMLEDNFMMPWGAYPV